MTRVGLREAKGEMTTFPTVELSDVAVIERTGVDPNDLDPDTRYLGLEHIERGGRIIGSDTVGGAALASTKFRFTPDHVLYGKLRPNLGKIARPDFAGVSSTDILPIRPVRVDRDYLAHFLAQPSMVEHAASRASGANLPRLSPAVLGRFTMPLPPIEEQRRIAAILDQADAVRTKRRQVLAHLEALAQSTFHAMFDDVQADEELGSHLEFLTSGSRGWAKYIYYADSGSRFIRIQNVGRGEFRLDDMAYVDAPSTAEARRTAVQAGDVLLSITADLGRTAVVPASFGEAYISQHLAIIRAPRFVPEFLSAYLQSPRGQRQVQKKNRGATKAGLNFDDVRSIQVPNPGLAGSRLVRAASGL